MAAIDYATGKLLAARFFPFEGSSGYLWLLKEMVKNNGIPISIYQDRHEALHRNDRHWSMEEQLAGRQEQTQVGLALKALGIDTIGLSPHKPKEGWKDFLPRFRTVSEQNYTRKASKRSRRRMLSTI